MVITLFSRRGGRHRRTWFWRRHRNDHPGFSPAEIKLINERFQVELAADRARRAVTSSLR